jgi:adenosylhomocysteine nucleosidase
MDATPRIGILIPVGPPDYAVIFDALEHARRETAGPFEFRSGTIAGVPVVLNVAPTDGIVARSLAAEEMLHHYNVRAFVYAGTSGGHLPPHDMRIGDIVLGAKHVDFSNFFMGKDGHIEADEFAGFQPGLRHFAALYAQPRLLGDLACSARRVATATTLPAWLNPGFPRVHPDIFYYGIQGTSTMWLADTAFIAKTMALFHEIDEDGDWYSAFVALLYRVPFIEVSVISDSIEEFPQTARGNPARPPGAGPAANVIAQRLSNRIVIDLIAHDGRDILRAGPGTATRDPFPATAYATPKDPRSLLSLGGCR